MKRWKLSPRNQRRAAVILSIPALLIVVWFIASIWMAVRDTYPDPARDLRMAERSCWVGPSDIQYGAVGTYMDQVLILGGKYWLDYWPRNPEGPTLVPVGQFEFVAVDVPEGTARAELTLELSFYYFPALSEPTWVGPTYAVRERAEEECESGPIELWQDTYVSQGEIAEEGGILFRMETKSPEIPGEMGVWDGHPLNEVSDREIYSRDAWDNQAWARMEAVFYDEAGKELGRAALSTPEGGEELAD